MPFFYSPSPAPTVPLSPEDDAYLTSWLEDAEANGDAETADVCRLALGGFDPPGGFRAVALAKALSAAALVFGDRGSSPGGTPGVLGAPVSVAEAEALVEAGFHARVHFVPFTAAPARALVLARSWEPPADAPAPTPAVLAGRAAVEAARRGSAGTLVFLRYDDLREAAVTPDAASDLLGSDAGEVFFVPSETGAPAPTPAPPRAPPRAPEEGDVWLTKDGVVIVLSVDAVSVRVRPAGAFASDSRTPAFFVGALFLGRLSYRHNHPVTWADLRPGQVVYAPPSGEAHSAVVHVDQFGLYTLALGEPPTPYNGALTGRTFFVLVEAP